MPSIYVKDELRAAVEAASGGKQTVLYTAVGQPSIMNVVPKFNLEDIDADLGTGTHPAFVVGGVEKTELFIGSYQGIIKNGELISMPSVDPSVSNTHDVFVSAARAAGPGFHVTTNAEYSALALWCWKNGFMPRGNTDYGRSSKAKHETARRQDSGSPGDANGSARTLTGSGPASWRHDNTPNGISDLCGNSNEWAPGLRLMDGEIQVIANNDAALPTTNMSRSSSAWQAIRASDGALVAPGTAGTLKYDAKSTSDSTLILSDTIVNRAEEVGNDELGGGVLTIAFDAMTAKAGLNIPAIAKVLGFYPVASGLGHDRLLARNYGERLLFRGGRWSDGAYAGLLYANLGYSRLSSIGTVGARPAFFL